MANWQCWDEERTIDKDLSGTAPEPTNPEGHVDPDRILTSSGESPTGGVSVGGESDRIQPHEWARRHGSASGAIVPDPDYAAVNEDTLAIGPKGGSR